MLELKLISDSLFSHDKHAANRVSLLPCIKYILCFRPQNYYKNMIIQSKFSQKSIFILNFVAKNPNLALQIRFFAVLAHNIIQKCQ